MEVKDLIVHHQRRAEDYYAYARWVAGKAKHDSMRALRTNQFREEAYLGAIHSMTARLLMGVEDAI